MKKIVFGLLLFTVACASTQNETQSLSAEDLYKQAYAEMEQTAWSRAAQSFEQIELEHPYSKLAAKAKLMSAYAYYKDEKYDDAILSLDRFIRYHPGNKDIDYAYYMKGMCYYDQIVGSEKDQENTAKAEEAFNQVIVRFPQSQYAKDAKGKMALIRDHMAGHELEIGRYYLNEKNYLSALNRFTTVVKDYQTTPQIEEALYRQVEVYTILGLKQEAKETLNVLAHNYPKSDWYKRAVEITK
ncbi:MAG: outer membrane protein assembly factor BamD [Alphaproteobacteria bacterium]|nr:outer membrane protein assembly factor BamD [Alphaproteobacteria bacterium]